MISKGKGFIGQIKTLELYLVQQRDVVNNRYDFESKFHIATSKFGPID